LLCSCTLLLDFDGELVADAGPPPVDAPPPGPIDAGRPADQVFEPNNDFAAATAIELNVRYDHIAVAPVGDKDFYAFTLAEERDLVIDCRFRTDDGDLDMNLYDAKMVEIAASESFDDDEQIVRTLPAGAYFLEIHGYMDSEANYDYRLVINAP
jgi:hypothetical protein